MRILLIEDNERLGQLIATGVQQAGFTIDRVTTGSDGMAALRTTRYDAVVLDLSLPDVDGLDVLRDLRTRGETAPVLVLTARDGVDDRVIGLNCGADDYVLKPFAMEELIARIRALLRRPGGALGATLSVGKVSFDTVAREVSLNGKVVPLARRELEVLEQLMRRAGRVVPKSVIEDSIYGFDEEISSNTIEVLVSRLRKRLQTLNAGFSIHTMRGIGYILSEDG
jgi:DNA-binding response OmpR family regulator